MAFVRTEKPRPHTSVIVTDRPGRIGLVSRTLPDAAPTDAAIELESHTQLLVRMTTQNFEEATRARLEGRKPDFKD